MSANHYRLPTGGTGEIREKDAGHSSGEHRNAGPGNAGADDATDMCLRSFHVRAVSDPASSERWIDVVASTAALDSYEEIVEQSWDLSLFEANPVVLWAHMSRDEVLGHASNVGVVSGNLEMRLNFVDETANPKAVRVFNSYKQKAMRAVSVGFYPRDIRIEMRNGKEVLVLSNNLLLEISCTPIGANPEALAKSHERIRQRAMARPNQITAAERGISTENAMDPKEKAALDAAMKAEREASEKKIADAEKALADEKAAHEKTSKALAAAIKLGVASLVECGRFAKDEIEEQSELASKDFALFEKLAAKRAIRGAAIVEATALPGSVAGAHERATADDVDNGAGLDALAKGMN